MMRPSLFLPSFVAATFGLLGTARAEDVSQTFRLSAGGPLAGFEAQTIEIEAAGGFPSSSAEAKSTDFGLLGAGFGVGLGYAFNDSALLGARVAFSSHSLDIDGETEKTSEFLMAPRFEFLIGQGDAIPYFLLTTGYRSLEGENMSGSGVVYGAGFGIHGFPQAGISLDPEVVLLGTSTTVEVGGVDAKASGYSVLFGITLSGWLGGKPASESASGSGFEGDSQYGTSGSGNAPVVTEPEPAAEPTPRQPPRNVVLEDLRGGLSVNTLVGATSLRLIGRPKEDGGSVQSDVRLPGTVSDCGNAGFKLGDEVLAAKKVRFASTSQIIVVWDMDTLQRVAKYDGVLRFEACGLSSKVSKSTHKALKRFVREFRTAAEHHGTWIEVEAPEAAPSPASNDGDGATAPAAAPGDTSSETQPSDAPSETQPSDAPTEAPADGAAP
jgi:hypothetical protein